MIGYREFRLKFEYGQLKPFSLHEGTAYAHNIEDEPYQPRPSREPEPELIPVPNISVPVKVAVRVCCAVLAKPCTM